MLILRPPDVAHFIDVFRRFYGPTHKAFGALDASGQASLAAAIVDLSARFNRSQSSCVLPAEYLEVVIER